MITGNCGLILWDGFPLHHNLGHGKLSPEWSLLSTLLRAQSRSWASAQAFRLCSSRLCPLAAQSPQTLSSISTQGVHWVLPMSPSLSCCLETVSRQLAEEIPGLPSSVFPSRRDHSFITWCSISSKPLFRIFYLLFVSSRRVNPFCFSILGRSRILIYV